MRFVVPRHSAILPQYNNQGIHANHVGMTRFRGRNELGYRNILSQLRIWIAEIGQATDAEVDNREMVSKSARAIAGPSHVLFWCCEC